MLPENVAKMVGFVQKEGKPVATCFLIESRGEMDPLRDDWTHYYIVTAEHAVPSDGAEREIWFPDENRSLRKLEVDEWHYGPGDLALAPWIPPDDYRGWRALPMNQLTTLHLGELARVAVGTTILYSGVLQPVPSMARQGQAMVRSATLGAVDVQGVTYTSNLGTYTAEWAHLIDCRSRAGFSGSPCFASMPYQTKRTQPLPPPLAAFSNKLPFSQMNFVLLMGMLVGFGDDDGIGVVLPVECIYDALKDRELVELRRELDEDRQQRDEAKGCHPGVEVERR